MVPVARRQDDAGMHAPDPIPPSTHVRFGVRTLTAAFVAISMLAVVACSSDRGGNTALAPGTAADAPAQSTATDQLLPVVPPAETGFPDVDARAIAVYDLSNGRWLAEHNADAPMAVGSVMKLLTSYVVLQAGDLGAVVTVPDLTADVDESVIGLYEGEQLPRDVLLRAMLIVSANDAARALAIDVGGDIEQFVSQMNDAAADVGMNNTHAANPVGLDEPGAHSTAHDMVLLATRLMADDTFRTAVGKPTATLHGQTFEATNDLLRTFEGATGVKTGHTTQAGYCLIGAATRDGRELIVAVFGAESDAARLQSATSLLNWGFSQP